MPGTEWHLLQEVPCPDSVYLSTGCRQIPNLELSTWPAEEADHKEKPLIEAPGFPSKTQNQIK